MYQKNSQLHYFCNRESGQVASRKARVAPAEWAAGVQPPPPTNPPLPPLISKRVYPCVRRERERKAGKHAQPDTTPKPGRKEVPPGRKGQSRPDLTNSPPRLRSRPDLVLDVGHTRKYTYENMFVVSQTSTGQVLVVGHKYKHMQICSLSARTSTGQRPTLESTRTVGHSSLSAKEELHYSTAPLIYFELPCNLLTVIICQLPSLYDTDTETTSQDPNYNICSTHAIYFCRGD